MTINYPKTRMEDLVEDLHGHKIADPYRWMEDLESYEVRAWIAAQNELTFEFLKKSPMRKKIQGRMTEL